MTQPQGKGKIDGFLGQNPTWGNVRSRVGKILEALDSNQVPTRYIIETTAKNGGRQIMGGLWANPLSTYAVGVRDFTDVNAVFSATGDGLLPAASPTNPIRISQVKISSTYTSNLSNITSIGQTWKTIVVETPIRTVDGTGFSIDFELESSDTGVVGTIGLFDVEDRLIAVSNASGGAVSKAVGTKFNFSITVQTTFENAGKIACAGSNVVTSVQDSLFGEKYRGTFEEGFTVVEQDNRIGRAQDGSYWEYVGGDFPKAVTAGTVPSGPDYEKVDLSAGYGFSRGAHQQEIEKRAAYMTLAQAQASDLKESQYVRLVDRGLGLNRVVDISDTGGAYLPLDASKKLRLDNLSRLTPSMFGPMTNPTERTSSLSACLSFATLTNGYYIELDNGVYDPIDITQSDVLIVTSGKPIFTLPENTVTSLDTVPVSALTVSGDDVKIYGDLYTDGNSATNDSSGYNLSNRRGELHIAGANFELHGTLHTLDAHYVGFSFGNETDTASRPYIERVVNHKSASYIASIWSADEWVIGGIVNKDEVQGFNNRVYTGNQSSSTQKANRGFIGYVVGKGTYCVYEINTLGLHVGYMDVAGWKSEATKEFKVGSARSVGTTFDAWGFGVIQSENFQADSITVDNYHGLQPRAVQISSSTGRIGSLTVDNNLSTVSCEVFTVPDGFTIDNIDLNGRNGTATGLRLPSGYTRHNLVIGNINSRGHTTDDVEIATYEPDNVKLLNINSDASISSAYDEVKRRNVYQEGTDTVQMTATGGTITLASDNDLLSWTKQGREISLQGRLVVSSSTGTGALRIAGVNSPPSDLPEASGEVPVTLYIESLTGSPAGVIQAKIPEGSTDIVVTRYNTGTVNDDVAGFLQAGSRIVISARYFV